MQHCRREHPHASALHGGYRCASRLCASVPVRMAVSSDLLLLRLRASSPTWPRRGFKEPTFRVGHNSGRSRTPQKSTTTEVDVSKIWPNSGMHGGNLYQYGADCRAEDNAEVRNLRGRARHPNLPGPPPRPPRQHRCTDEPAGALGSDRRPCRDRDGCRRSGGCGGCRALPHTVGTSHNAG